MSFIPCAVCNSHGPERSLLYWDYGGKKGRLAWKLANSLPALIYKRFDTTISLCALLDELERSLTLAYFCT